eukprot:TRINITY_DN7201_c0_g1_i1.p1 TRINITY_DN7201_c0_g1~~TRINITY_DN7201_c0_g1_i1.p1  ORF type:complete len:1378 (+),score=270.87 TRINITY_DN7201_c0_g1_i1:58-4191(+)
MDNPNQNNEHGSDKRKDRSFTREGRKSKLPSSLMGTSKKDTEDGTPKEASRFREFILSESTTDQWGLILKNCISAIDSIRAVWGTVSKTEDAEEFIISSKHLASELATLSNSPSLENSNIDRYRQFLGNLTDFHAFLKAIPDLETALTIRSRRHPISKMNARLLQECFRLNSSPAEVSEERKKLSGETLGRITQPEALKMWEEEFQHNDFHLVPWAAFIKALKKNTKSEICKSDEELLRRIIDLSNTGYVTPHAFSDFLHSFGPLQHCVENVNRICKQSWFHGFVSAEEASRLLLERPKGTYLVRFSRSRADSFALEYVLDMNEGPLTVLIRCQMPLGVSVEEEGGIKTFPTIEDLIKHYSATLSKPFSCDYDRQPWFLGAVTLAAAREMLHYRPTGTFLIHFHPTVVGWFVCSYVNKEQNVIQIELQKVLSGYQIALLTEDPQTGTSSSTPFSEEIFSDVTTFIQSHHEDLRYNYSEDNVPSLPCESLLDYNEYPAKDENYAPKDINGHFTIDAPNLFAETLANYPKGSGGFNVLCDTLRTMEIGNKTILALADGCGWGQKARKASETASKAVVDYLSSDEVQSNIVDTVTCRHEILSSFIRAHEKIVEGKQGKEIWGCGTTTLIVGMVLKLKNGFLEDEWAFVCASVGDCKAFHWSKKTGRVVDITFGNRHNVRDAKDCGGRLGPYLSNGDPDLRNLETYFFPCKAGDIILLCSDGVHDNFDPETLGLTPGELTPDVTQKKVYSSDWDNLPVKEVELLKSRYACKKVQERLRRCKDYTPQGFANSLVNYATEVTKATRDFMEANPQSAEPADYKAYPGKMDHTTCIAYKIGSSDSNNPTKKKRKQPSILINLPKVKKQPVIKLTSSGTVNLGSTNNSSSGGVVNSTPDEFTVRTEELVTPLKNFIIRRYDSSSAVRLKRPPECMKTSYNQSASAWTTSTYPNLGTEKEPKRLRDPISEFYSLDISQTRSTVVLCTGCNFGQISMEASNTATLEWSRYVEKKQLKITDSRSAASVLLQGISKAHKAIQKECTQAYTPSDTEVGLTCGMLCALPTLSIDSSPWLFICANIGPNRAFCYSHETKKLREITTGNESLPLSENGGKIGGGGGGTFEATPDLKSLKLYNHQCEQNDIIIIVSSTVYHNLDPEILGIPIKDFLDPDQLSASSKKSNSSAKKLTWLKYPNEKRSAHRLRYMEYILREATSETPTSFVDVIISRMQETTKARRELIQAKPERAEEVEKEPYSRNVPGKMGHITCIAFQVGGSDTTSSSTSSSSSSTPSTLQSNNSTPSSSSTSLSSQKMSSSKSEPKLPSLSSNSPARNIRQSIFVKFRPAELDKYQTNTSPASPTSPHNNNSGGGGGGVSPLLVAHVNKTDKQ